MLNEKMQDALNRQVNAEMYSAYLYLSMSAYFSSIGLDGFAAWMKAQAGEEMFHAMKIFDFVNERAGRALLYPVDEPPKEWESPLAVFEATLEHEKKVTGMINDLVDLAIELKDHASNNFLQWYVSEQVEEEATSDEILNKVRMIGEGKAGVFMLDRELGARTFVWPPPAGE